MTLQQKAEMALGLLVLASPLIIALILLILTERNDGKTRLVIKDGRVRRRRSTNREQIAEARQLRRAPHPDIVVDRLCQ